MTAVGFLVIVEAIAMIGIAITFLGRGRWRAWRRWGALALLTTALCPVFGMTLTGDVSLWFPHSWWVGSDDAQVGQIIVASLLASLLAAQVSATLFVLAFAWWRSRRSSASRPMPD